MGMTDSEVVSKRDVVVKFKDKDRPSPIAIPAHTDIPSEPGTSNSDDINIARTPREDEDGKHDKKKIGHRRVDKVTGNVTYKKVPTHYLQGSIQLGIREGSAVSPSHTYGDFRFKCYAPIAFRYFRELFKIKPEDFLSSVCIEELVALSNPGASGSIFYLSHDDRYIIKTVQHKEADFLQKLLPGYYMNLQQNAHTLLPKFFGLFCYHSLGKNIRLLVMNNLLPSSIKLHQKYDLKGSTYKRRASRHERTKANPTLKDLDFLEECPDGILLESTTYDALMKTISRDCLVLQSFKIMDYSLLVGVHNLDAAIREKHSAEGTAPPNAETQASTNLPKPNNTGWRPGQRHKSMFSTFESIQANAMPVDLGDEYPEGGIPARNSKGERLLVFVGIIDILQNYRLFKKMEHGFKSILHDGDSISVHNPNFYSQRFQDFMLEQVFKKIPSPLKHSPSTRKPKGRDRRGTATSTDDPRPRSHVDDEKSALTARPDLVPTETRTEKPEPSGLTPFGRQSSRRHPDFGRQNTLTRPEATGLSEGAIERKVERLFASDSPATRQRMNRSVSSDAGDVLETMKGSGLDKGAPGCQKLVALYPNITMEYALQLMEQYNNDTTACVRALDRMDLTSVVNPLFRTPDSPNPHPPNRRGARGRAKGNLGRGSFVSRPARSSPSTPGSPPTDASYRIGRSKFYRGNGRVPRVSVTAGSPIETPGSVQRQQSSPGMSPLARSSVGGAPPSLRVQLPTGIELQSHGSFPSLHITQAGQNIEVQSPDVFGDNTRRSSLPPSQMLVQPQISVQSPGSRMVFSPSPMTPTGGSTGGFSCQLPGFRISMGGGPPPSKGQPKPQQTYEPDFVDSFLYHQKKSLEAVEEELEAVTRRLTELQTDVNEMEQTVLLRRKHSLSMSNIANADSVRDLHSETRQMQADINAMNKELIAQKDEALRRNANVKHKGGANFFDQMDSTGQKMSVGTLIRQGTHALTALPVGCHAVETREMAGAEAWNCPACTYTNHAALAYCEMCDIPRVQERVPEEGELDWVVYDLTPSPS